MTEAQPCRGDGVNRTCCIAIRVPKGSVEDCLGYETAEEYKYFKTTECDSENDHIFIGVLDHKVGREHAAGRFEGLETSMGPRTLPQSHKRRL